MLPNNTQRYGDMLKELYDGLKSGSLSDIRVEEIRRVFNELAERENVYKQWLQPNKESKMNFPTIGQPTWTRSPLHAYTFELLTPLSVADNTATYITFDTFYQHGNAFAADDADKSHIIINSPGLSFNVVGTVQWDANATGYRYVAVQGYKQDGTSLGFAPLHSFDGSASPDPNVLPVNYVADLEQLADMKYMRFFVRQTSGGALNCHQILLSAFLT